MRITRVEVWRRDLELRKPYAIAYEVVDRAPNVYLSVHTASGLVGFGAAAPSPFVTGETAESVEEALRGIVTSLLVGEDALRLSWLLTRVERVLPHSPSARAAVDMALYDLLGKKAGLPVWQLLGGFRRGIRTSVTIGILPVFETVAEARRLTAEGFRSLKIKGGIVADEDVERILRVREAVGSRVELRFDANQGYDAATAIRFVDSCRTARLEVLEQPTPRDDMRQLVEVTRSVPVRVMADESLVGLVDAFRLARRRLVDMVNVKLMKVGGIHTALKVLAVAEAADMTAMVGCMDESALAISAGLHVALSRRTVRYADLDGHLDLLDDPARGAVVLRRGTLYPSSAPGLGWLGP